MFTVNKNKSGNRQQTSKTTERENMATKTKEVSEVGIIGQMYEDRKTKKVGVLESREEKFKTLMMRDKDGKSFNITYSTFRSNWRKYNGDEVISTSTQVEEKRAEEKKREANNKKTVESKSEMVKLSTEDKVKKLKALDEVVCSAVKEKNLDLKVDRTAKGGISVRYKKSSLFQIWIRYATEQYSFRTKEDFDKFVTLKTDKEVLEEKGNNIRYRVPFDKLDETLSVMLDAADKYLQSKEENEKKEKQEEK